MSEKAGLQVGDVIQRIDKTDVKSFHQVVELLRAHNPGDKVTVKVLRGKESKELILTVQRRPDAAQRNPNRPYSFSYGGQRENVQDQQGPNSFEYGGLYKSTRRRRIVDAHQQRQSSANVLQPGPRRSERRQLRLRPRHRPVSLQRRRQDIQDR